MDAYKATAGTRNQLPPSLPSEILRRALLRRHIRHRSGRAKTVSSGFRNSDFENECPGRALTHQQLCFIRIDETAYRRHRSPQVRRRPPPPRSSRLLAPPPHSLLLRPRRPVPAARPLLSGLCKPDWKINVPEGID